MRLNLFSSICSSVACVICLCVISFSVVAENSYEGSHSGLHKSYHADVVLGQLYIASVYVAAEPNSDKDMLSINPESHEITVSGASLLACQSALKEVLNHTKNIISRSDCEIKDQDPSMIFPSSFDPPAKKITRR